MIFLDVILIVKKKYLYNKIIKEYIYVLCICLIIKFFFYFLEEIIFDIKFLIKLLFCFIFIVLNVMLNLVFGFFELDVKKIVILLFFGNNINLFLCLFILLNKIR